MPWYIIVAIIATVKVVLFALCLYVDLLMEAKYSLTDSDTEGFVLFAIFCPIFRLLYIGIKLTVDMQTAGRHR